MISVVSLLSGAIWFALLVNGWLLPSTIHPPSAFSNWTGSVLKMHSLPASIILKQNMTYVMTKNRNTWMKSYAPYSVRCPRTTLVRKALQTMGTKESSYMREHSKFTALALEEFIGRHLPELKQEINYEDIRIALALSGGGFRAMLTGYGIIRAYDGRILANKVPGHVGGLLQSLSYISGISGGSWLVVAHLLNDLQPLTVLEDVIKNELRSPLLEGVPSFNLEEISGKLYGGESDSSSLFNVIFHQFMLSRQQSKTVKSSIAKQLATTIKRVTHFYKDIHIEVQLKRKAGYLLSLTDYWGRALSRKLFPVSERSPGVTISATTQLSSFKSYRQPFPIMCAIETNSSSEIDSSSSHVFEINPYEFGSWDPYLGAFANIKYLGTKLVNGKVMGDCMNGFDNIGFLTGTSSSLFLSVCSYVQRFLEANGSAHSLLKDLLGGLWPSGDENQLGNPQLHPEYALFSPNPFFQFQEPRRITNAEHLYLVDGGTDGINIPIHPFLQKARRVDMILAFDITGDVMNYPNGTTLKKSSDRYHLGKETVFIQPNSGIMRLIFPFVPSSEQFLARYSRQPFFLGCDIEDFPARVAANFTNTNTTTTRTNTNTNGTDYMPPIIVFTPNSNICFSSNTSTFQLSYTEKEINGMFDNGSELASAARTSDGEFAACLACAALKRTFDRGTAAIPEKCRLCFHKYCYKKDQ